MNKTILLIEDNKDVRENTSEILELSNYRVLTAENGKIGVEIALQENPDLIICDIMMPVLDGYGVIHMLSKNSQTAHIPFIFLTAKGERTDFRKGMELGADDYITKPFDDVELLKAVESRLKKMDAIKSGFSKNIDGLNSFLNEVNEISDLKKISQHKKIKTFKKKEIIFSEGNVPSYFYFLSKGKVKTFKQHEYGKELITTLYKEGDFFGHIALLEENNYVVTAEALEESEIVLIPKEDFFELIHNNITVMQKFIKILSDNIIEKEEQLVNLAYSSVRKRVANALMTLYKRYNTANNKDSGFNISISREDLANIVGTATESLIRTLSDFKTEKLIDIKGSNITILNIDALSKLKA